MDEENVVHMYNGILALKRNEIGLFVGMWMDLESVKQSDVPGFPGSLDGKASAYNAGDPVRSLGREDPLEKEMATHFSIHAWKIPWTEEPGGLQSMGSQRVGHD